MQIVKTEDEIKDLISKNKMYVLYFTGSKCGACEVIKHKIESILIKFPEIKSGEISGEENLKIAADYNVFSLPVFLLFIEGKETLRIGKNVDLIGLKESIKRYYEMIQN